MFQARLCYVPTGGTKKELRGVGTFETVEEAVAALAEAQRKFKEGGAAAVWQNEKETRAARGTVRMLRPNTFVIVIARVCSYVVLRWYDRKRSRSRRQHTR